MDWLSFLWPLLAALPLLAMAINTKSIPFDGWVTASNTDSLSAQTATTAWTDLGKSTTWEVRGILNITTAGAGTTYTLQLGDNSAGDNPVEVWESEAAIDAVGARMFSGRFPTAKQFWRMVMTGGAPTFDVQLFAQEVS